MLPHCTAEDDVSLNYLTPIVKLTYEFVDNRLQASSESVELVLFDVFERQTSGLAAAAFEMVRSASLSELGKHTQSDPLLSFGTRWPRVVWSPASDMHV